MSNTRAGVVVLLAGMAVPAHAELRHDFAGVSMVTHGGVSLTGAMIDSAARGGDVAEAGDIDASGSLNLEWISASGVMVGAFASGDTASNRPDTLKNDRLHGYVASEWGRAEIGLTSGPARRMSFYAPVLGAGQIRGDFARYAGRSALLWPIDSRQAFKLAYFSPPIGNLRMGISWAPEVDRLGAIQDDVFEAGAQYEEPVGAWVLGASAAYVSGSAHTPGLADIDSWSLGVQARKGRLMIGGAYVDRGDSNLFCSGCEQSEVNIGVAWREENWAIATSAARTSANNFENTLLALGGSYNLGRHITLTADIVRAHREDKLRSDRTDAVLVAGIDVRF